MVLDIILLIFLLMGAWKGWRDGALSMVLSIVILVIAGVLASQFAHKVGAFLHIGPPIAQTIIGFLFIFVVLVIAASFLKRMIRPKKGILRGLDGIIGLALGLIRSAFILSIILIPISFMRILPKDVTDRSVLYPVVFKTSTPVIGVFKDLLHARSDTNTTMV